MIWVSFCNKCGKAYSQKFSERFSQEERQEFFQEKHDSHGSCRYNIVVSSSDTSDEVESERLTILEESDLDFKYVNEEFGAGSYGAHEAIDRIHIAISIWEDHIMNHPTVLVNPDFYRLASEVERNMAELYQAIGVADYERREK